jgi:hypothetical protein
MSKLRLGAPRRRAGWYRRRYHQAFHDITTGNTTVRFPPKTFRGYEAAPGWDAATGLGSPDARVLVPLLARARA